MTTSEKIEALNWYDMVGKLKTILNKLNKKEDGIDAVFTVSGYIYTVKDGQVISKVLE